jgi:hypothetical protein
MARSRENFTFDAFKMFITGSKQIEISLREFGHPTVQSVTDALNKRNSIQSEPVWTMKTTTNLYYTGIKT